MKKVILIIALFIGLVVVIFATYYMKIIYDEIELGKPFNIIINENEVIDYKSVDQKQYVNGIQRKWFTLLLDSEREKLVSYMKENNYKIVPGRYHLYQGYKFKDLLKELKFEEITQT